MHRRPRALILAIAIAGHASSVQAHGLAEPGAHGWLDWRPDIWIVIAVAAALAAYGLGVARLWRAAGVGRGIGRMEAMSFSIGLLLVVIALASPLEHLAGALLTAHMVQHVILIALAPLFLVLGRVEVAFAWSLPRTMRRAVARQSGLRSIAGAFHLVMRPLPAAILHGAAVWIWHAPGLFQAALSNPLLHDLEHASFFVTALIFWYGTLIAMRSPSTMMAGMVGIVITLIHGGLMGALITLTPSVLYPAYAGSSDAFGLTPLEDQQLAGLIMWVPASAIYLAAGLYLAARLLDATELRARQQR